MLVELPDIGSNTFEVEADPRATVEALVSAIQPRLKDIFGTKCFEAGFKLELADGTPVSGQEQAFLSDFPLGQPLLKLYFNDAESARAGLQASQAKTRADCFKRAVDGITKRFGVASGSIDRQTSEDINPRLQINDSWLLVSSMSGKSHKIGVGRSFEAVELQWVLYQAEQLFGIPSGGAMLVWDDRCLDSELGRTLQDIGLSSKDSLVCLQKPEVLCLPFLDHLRVDEVRFRTGGHSVKFHVVDHVVGTGLERFEVFEDTDSLGTCEDYYAQILWLQDSEPQPTCLLQTKVHSEDRLVQRYQAPAAVWDMLGPKLGFMTGEHALGALTCIGLSEEMRMTTTGFGESCFPFYRHEGLQDTTPLWVATEMHTGSTLLPKIFCNEDL